MCDVCWISRFEMCDCCYTCGFEMCDLFVIYPALQRGHFDRYPNQCFTAIISAYSKGATAIIATYSKGETAIIFKRPPSITLILQLPLLTQVRFCVLGCHQPNLEPNVWYATISESTFAGLWFGLDMLTFAWFSDGYAGNVPSVRLTQQGISSKFGSSKLVHYIYRIGC